MLKIALAKKFHLFVYFIFLTNIFCSIPALSQEEIIVEATAINEEKIEPSRSTSIVSEQDIKVKKSSSVADLLRSIPGLEVVRQGGHGQTTSVFIRGARAEDTLVLIDGTESNDAMSPSRGFDFSTLSPDNILRIEIFRGPQSVRFGAGALGGVINIVTKEGSNPSQTNYFIEGGAYETYRAALGASGKIDHYNYSAGLDRLSTKGFSAASENLGNTEADGSEVHTASTKFSWVPNARSKLETTFRFTKSDIEIDRQGGTGGDDPNDTTVAQQTIAGLLGSHRFFNDHLKSNFGFYFSEVERDGRNQVDSADATNSSDHFLSENKKIQSDHELILAEEHTLRFSLQWREESGIANSMYNGTPTNISRKTESTMGESLTYLFESSTWFFDVGARADQSSNVGDIPSYRTSVGRQFSESKIFVTYGTGFKLPSLYQLYSPYGDADLQEEYSTTVEATIEQKLGLTGLASITFFENQFQDLIDFNTATNKYYNVTKAQSRGAEIQSSVAINTTVNIRVSYTYLDSVDKTTGSDLIRRPKNAWSVSTQYKKKSFEGSADYSFRGKRADLDPNTFSRIEDPSYGIFNISSSYKISNSLKFHGRIENVFDKNYEEVAGYTTAGISFFAGLSGEL